MHIGTGAGLGTALHDLVRFDQAVQGLDRVNQRLRGGRATGRIHVDGHDLVHTLHDCIVIEHSTGAGADAHRDDPLGLHHLVIDLAQDRCHLLAHATRDNHDVSLTRRRTENLHPESGDVVVRCTRRHHLDGAARKTERRRP